MLALLAMAPQDLARTEAKERSTSDGRYLLGAADRCIVELHSGALCPLHDCLQSLQSLEQSRDLRSADGWGNKGHRLRGSTGAMIDRSRSVGSLRTSKLLDLGA